MPTKTKKHHTGPQRSIFGQLIYGRVISSDFFAHNWLAIFTIIVMILIYITNKYHNQTKMEEIRALNRQLEIVKTERIRARSEYMSRTRESSMQSLVDSLHLNLHVQDAPPFKLNNSNEER
ncbi:MAG: hypothetical protein J6C78_01890 [Muribaculaceae bacterium]|nr:hypothetical protein [Muribaculaceae bacterium]